MPKTRINKITKGHVTRNDIEIVLSEMDYTIRKKYPQHGIKGIEGVKYIDELIRYHLKVECNNDHIEKNALVNLHKDVYDPNTSHRTSVNSRDQAEEFKRFKESLGKQVRRIAKEEREQKV